MVWMRRACLALFLAGVAGCGGSTGAGGANTADEATKQKEAQIERFKERNTKAVKKPAR